METIQGETTTTSNTNQAYLEEEIRLDERIEYIEDLRSRIKEKLALMGIHYDFYKSSLDEFIEENFGLRKSNEVAIQDHRLMI